MHGARRMGPAPSKGANGTQQENAQNFLAKVVSATLVTRNSIEERAMLRVKVDIGGGELRRIPLSAPSLQQLREQLSKLQAHRIPCQYQICADADASGECLDDCGLNALIESGRMHGRLPRLRICRADPQISDADFDLAYALHVRDLDRANCRGVVEEQDRAIAIHLREEQEQETGGQDEQQRPLTLAEARHGAQFFKVSRKTALLNKVVPVRWVSPAGSASTGQYSDALVEKVNADGTLSVRWLGDGSVSRRVPVEHVRPNSIQDVGRR